MWSAFLHLILAKKFLVSEYFVRLVKNNSFLCLIPQWPQIQITPGAYLHGAPSLQVLSVAGVFAKQDSGLRPQGLAFLVHS